MSSNDASGVREDAFCTLAGVAELSAAPQVVPPLPVGGTLPVQQPSTPPQPQPQPLLWQNHMLGTPFISSTTTNHSPQQQQHYNEFLYSMYAATPPETYSVLPVGHGNFLKVYHCAENPANEAGTLYHHQAQQFQQHQSSPAYHVPPQTPQPATAQIFNSYELFASNSIISTTESPAAAVSSSVSHEVPLHSAAPQTPLLLRNEDHANSASAANTTNMFINKLVNNWSPSLAGGAYSPFGAPPMQQMTAASATQTAQSSPGDQQSSTPTTILPEVSNNATAKLRQGVSKAESAIAATILPPQPTKPTSPVQQAQCEASNGAKEVLPSAGASPVLATGQPTEVKKRIVAEVKPMRMTYSDVLSKFNHQEVTATPTQTPQNGKQGGKVGNNGKPSGERKTDAKNTASDVPSSRRQATSSDETRAAKKSPLHENKENLSGNKSSKRSSNNISFSSNIGNNNASSGTSVGSAQPKQAQKRSNASGDNKKRTTTTTNHNNNNNNGSNKRNDVDAQGDGGGYKQRANDKAEKDYNAFYNVAAAKQSSNSNNDSERAPKISYAGVGSSSSAASAHSRKATKGYYSSASNLSYGSAPMRSRYSNVNSNNANSYASSSRRNRGFYTSSPSAANRNYELAKRFLSVWLEWTLKVLTWLFYLVYDIVVLGFSMVYERLAHSCECGVVYMKQWRHELKQNSNKPGFWLKDYWRRFDARFKKDSRWAFWRRFYKKKPPEPAAETFKSGRLPQTGEEAMYSLLNCRGKDAYSILGVPADSSQEQIRKHYKKIAVLVHPDKNKQAGAEEAFKVLQRAFELIGEPENRLSYDRSLAEALHAEKAWTELHDLLSQLQTKISEAANTIRCSTCGHRHGRKLTDRAQFAARECASCKIRHSAREGDIWAETTLMGLRWKYLALMEGKVYDITEWANCQKESLSHLEPNSHIVQYRIVRGAQQQPHQAASHQHHSPHHHGPQQERAGGAGAKFKRDFSPSEASLHEFLDNLYSGQHPSQPNFSAFSSSSSRRRTRRN